jgi:hypothetical protein
MSRKKSRKREHVFVFTTIYGRKYRVTGKSWVHAYENFIRRNCIDEQEKGENTVFCHKERSS